MQIIANNGHSIRSIILFPYNIATVAFNGINAPIFDFCDYTDVIWFSVRFSIEEDDHTEINELVTVGSVDF